MPNIYAENSDGVASYYAVASWATARSSAAGTGGSNVGSRTSYAVATQYVSGRGSTVPLIYRSWFIFDTSGISVTPSSATLKLYGYSTNTADLIAVKLEQPLEATVKNNFDHIDGCASQLAASDGAGTGTLASCGTDYSAEVTTWSTSGYNSITLNSDALSDMANDDSIGIMLLEYDRDYLDTISVGDTVVRSGLYYANYTGTFRDPYIDYTAGSVSGYSHTVMGVSSGDISKVKGVATADIDKVIGV